jgi:hypothetical protein
MASLKIKPLTFDPATDLLRQPGYRLMQFKNNRTKLGHDYYVVPGGFVEEKVARKILEHPLCHVIDDGLFPGNPQSWSLYYGDQNDVAALLAQHDSSAA